MKIHTVAFILLIVGGLAWGLEAIGFGLSNYLPHVVLVIIYALVALSAIYEAVSHKNFCKECEVKSSSPSMQAPM